jgi:beta-galactosidase
MKHSLILLTALLLAPLAVVHAAEVRVSAADGVPRILVDGKPVRARLFWGAPGTLPLPVSGSQVITREFTAVATETSRATLHMRFGSVPGEVVFDELRVTDLDTARDVIPLCDFEGGPESFTRDWISWPTGAANTVGTVAVTPGAGRDGSSGLRITLKAPATGVWPDFHVAHLPNLALESGHRYRIQFWVRVDQPRDLRMHFTRSGAWDTLGGLGDVFFSQINLAAGADVNLITFGVRVPWPAPGEAVDWTPVDGLCQSVLAANPKALLIPRISMNAPDWWLRDHPDEAMRWDDGRSRKYAVVASPLYRREAAERLTALITHLEEKFGDRVAGYHPAGQNSDEWFYVDTWSAALNGYAPADQAAWRLWLSARYEGDAGLRAAWKSPNVILETAEVPTPAARRAAPAGVFRDPVTERPLIDFAEFQQEAMADCVCGLARAARQASNGRKLILFFYGYNFDFAGVGLGPATSGHYAMRRVLASPDIDVLCSPISYQDRGLGGSASTMTAAESVALAGKLWLNEDDTATYLAPVRSDHPVWKLRVPTLAESNALLVRNVAQAALRNYGTWWMDLSASGQFNDPALWEQMIRLKAVDDVFLRTPIPYRPQVASVIDERSMIRVAAGGDVVTRPGVYEVRTPLGRMGAPYGQYHTEDVAAGLVPAKLYVFLTPWCLSAEQRQSLLNATAGSLRLWCYAPGYFEGDRVTPDAMRELTGFALQPVSVAKAWATPTELGRKLGLTQALGVERPVRPLFAATDAKPEETLAVYPDGSPAIAMRRQPDGWSLFVGVPGLTSELLRLAARQAGVHLFTSVDCNIQANGPFISVHAAQDGPLELDLGSAGAVQDALTGESKGNGPRCTLPLKRGETRVLRKTPE